jgi:hypothetical protein
MPSLLPTDSNKPLLYIFKFLPYKETDSVEDMNGQNTGL